MPVRPRTSSTSTTSRACSPKPSATPICRSTAVRAKWNSSTKRQTRGSADMKMQFVLWCLLTVAIAGAQQTPPQGPRKPPAAPPADAGAAVDSLGVSLQDLNAIRDGNLSRIQKDGGCPPETAARLADLRLKLRRAEADLSGETLSTTAPVDAQAIAATWFKRPVPEAEPAAARESRLL